MSGQREPARRRWSAARRLSPFAIFSIALMGVFILGLLYPVGKAIVWTFHDGGQWDLSAFRDFAGSDTALKSIPYTIFVVLCASLISAVAGFTLAYLNERTDAHTGLLTDMIPFIPLLMPSIAGAYGWALTLAPRVGYANQVWSLLFGGGGPFNAFSMTTLIFVYSINGTPFAYLIIAAALRNLDPSLEEQSRICGASRWRTLTRAVMPAMLPSIGAAFLMVIWTAMSNLAVPAAIAEPAGIPIMSMQIIRFLNTDYPPQYGPALVMAFIMVAIIGPIWFLASQIRKRGLHSTVGGKARRAPRRALGIWKWPALTMIILWAATVVLVPLASLAMVALNGFWAGNLHVDHFSLRHITVLFSPESQTFTALSNSLQAALIVATVGSVMAAVISVFVTSRKNRAVTVADGFFKLPTILPKLVLSLGIVLAYAGQPFMLGGSFAILVLAFLLEQVPRGTLTTDPIAAQVGRELAEASQMSGASALRTFLKVYFPLMLPGTVVAWTLLFVHVIGDLEVSAIVASTHNPTIGSQMLRLGDNGDYATIAALAMVVVLISIGTVMTMFVLTRRRMWA
jgi:iron(III) transport system permease protein